MQKYTVKKRSAKDIEIEALKWRGVLELANTKRPDINEILNNTLPMVFNGEFTCIVASGDEDEITAEGITIFRRSVFSYAATWPKR